MTTTIEVRLERLPSARWRASVRVAEETLRVEGRSLARARRIILLRLAQRLSSPWEVRETIVLPDSVRRALVDRREALESSRRAAEAAVTAARAAARELVVDSGMSHRDAAGILGLSHTRVRALLRPSS